MGIRSVATLKSFAVRGTAFTVLGLVASQALRLGSNLALTRLLAPEAFGVAALINTLLLGLWLVTMFGVDLSVVQNARGTDTSFLNTAWTMESVRGAIITVVGCALAIPFARFYGDPQLRLLIPAACLTLLFQGMTSTKLYSHQREIKLGRVILIDLAGQIAGAIVMIAIAYAFRTTWALVFGPLAYRFTRLVLSHFALPGIKNRFHWDKEAARSIYTFGSWILIATTITFFATRLDIMMIGKLLPLERLGVYSIAGQLAALPIMVGDQVGNQVLFPALASAYRNGHEEMVVAFERARRVALPILLASTLGIALFAPAFFSTLYDGRYADAGWMTQLMMIGVWFAILQESYGRVLQVIGQTRTLAAANAIKLGVTCVASIVGFQLFDAPGFIVGCGLGAAAGFSYVAFTLARQQLDSSKQVARYTSAGVALGMLCARVAPILTILPPLGRRFLMPILVAAGMGWWVLGRIAELFRMRRQALQE